MKSYDEAAMIITVASFKGGVGKSTTPIRTLPFDAEQDPDLALQVEVVENEQRRDYTPNEVRAIALSAETKAIVLLGHPWSVIAIASYYNTDSVIRIMTKNRVGSIYFIGFDNIASNN